MTMIPASGCLLASWVHVTTKNPHLISAHFPVFGLLGDKLTPVIELHGRPATADELVSWLTETSDRGSIFATNYPDGLWRWDSQCKCGGKDTTREPQSAEEVESMRGDWQDRKARVP